MDIFLHAFWGLTITRFLYPKNKKVWLWGALLAVLPDILGAAPWMFYRNVLKIYDIWQIPSWVVNLYSSTHNLFAALLIFIVLNYIGRKYIFLSLAYLSHVLLDVFAHCEPIGTKLFFPISNWSYCSPLYIVTYGPSTAAWSKGLLYIHIIQYLFLILINTLFIGRKEK